MKDITITPFVEIDGIKLPIDEDARRLFGQWELKNLNVVPFQRVGKACWDVITVLPYEYALRSKFLFLTNQTIGLVYFVEIAELNRVLKSYFKY